MEMRDVTRPNTGNQASSHVAVETPTRWVFLSFPYKISPKLASTVTARTEPSYCSLVREFPMAHAGSESRKVGDAQRGQIFVKLTYCSSGDLGEFLLLPRQVRRKVAFQ